MKILSGKALRAQRRRQIITELLTVIDCLTPNLTPDEIITIKQNTRMALLELTESITIDTTAQRKRHS